ncbi:uncharacterized protein [Hoplias malabaricus]|uniref:uncharacterized protein isoform X1 n=2 Tax=Hoplias malabaricus TaxID=27720 RepID=UPI00346217F6
MTATPTLQLLNIISSATQLRWRRLWFVAGAAAAGAGLYFILSSRTGHPEKTATANTAAQTVAEDPEQRLRDAVRPVEPDVLCHPYVGFVGQVTRDEPEVSTDETGTLVIPSGPMIPYSCPRLFLERLFVQSHGGMQKTFWTLCFSCTEWLRVDKKRVCVRRHYVELIRGARTYHWWIHTNDFYVPSSKGPILMSSTARVTLAQRVEGQLTRVASCLFTKEHTSKTSEGVEVTEVLRTCRSFFSGREAWYFTSSSDTEVIHPDPFPDPQPESTPETSGDAEAVAREVPSLHVYSQIRRITSFPLKLRALRQAFTIMLSEPDCRHNLRDVGSMILEDLATLNDRDVRLFQELYHRLLLMAESPYYREVIVEELAESGIQNFNFMDVVFEVVLLRIQAGAQPPICPRPEGFLHHLLAVISSVSAVTGQSRPRADRYLLLVKSAMLLFLESIFTLEESAYNAPGSLFRVVWEIFESHVDDLLDRLKDV